LSPGFDVVAPPAAAFKNLYVVTWQIVHLISLVPRNA